MNVKTIFFLPRSIEVANQKLGLNLSVNDLTLLLVIRHIEQSRPPTFTSISSFCNTSHIRLSLATIERHLPPLVAAGIVLRTDEDRPTFASSPLGRDYIRIVHNYIHNKRY